MSAIISSVRAVKYLSAIVMAVVGAGLAIAPSASATSASNTWKLSGGDTFQVNAWHCGVYVSTCSWTASTKLLGTTPLVASWIRNRTELEAHGWSASLKISKKPEANLTMKSKGLGQVEWTNTNAWISDNSGTMKPGWTTAYVSVRSCGSSKVTNSINVSENACMRVPHS